MSLKQLDRQMFSISRAAEYFDARELQAQTGQDRSDFATVVLKELCDNGLDAAEAHGVAPVLGIAVTKRGGILRIAVEDNAAGLPPEALERILDFNTRTSDKATYRTPTRGAQGNALKTVFGIPHALGGFEGGCAPIEIVARGIRHRIRAWVDPASELRIDHDQTPVEPEGCTAGTAFSVRLPADAQAFNPKHWARAFSLFNPHASVQIDTSVDSAEHAEC